MADNFNDGASPASPSRPTYTAAGAAQGQATLLDSFYNYGPSATSPATLPPGATARGIALPASGAPGEPAASTPALGGAGSFYFSFCGTDGLMIGDVSETNQSVTSANGATTPLLSPATPSTPATGSGRPFTNSHANHTLVAAAPSSATVVSLMNPTQLASVNHEYFLGIPTPSAPSRTDYPGSSATSNCSSASHHQLQQASERAASPLGANSSSAHSASLPRHSPHAMPVTAAQHPGDDGNVVQKDVLALMAAEQQQQKFVLQQRNVYMSGLPINFRPSAFRAMCGVFGRIESSKLCMEADDSSRCRGFGFVLFYDVESANSCISSLNGKVMQGRTLQVRRADLSAAPQPLHPVTQRNRTGSGLVSPPSLGTTPGTTQASVLPPHPANAGFPFYSPHPPATMPVAANPVVISSLPFTLATPTVGGPTTPMQMVAANKSMSTNSSYPANSNASVSSSLGASATPTVVYASNSSMLPGMRPGMPMMQLFTAMPPGSTPGAMVQQPQQPQSSVSSRDALTPHTTTPSSLASSGSRVAFTGPTARHSLQSQQQQQQQLPQHAIPFKPQPPMQPPVQPQRPMSAGSRVPLYSGFDSVTSPPSMHAGRSIGGGAGASATGAGAPGSMVALPSCYSASGTAMSEYFLTADPNTSASNVFYFIPQ